MFIKGTLYERIELLKFIGSKQPQSGIIWNKEGSDSIIITTRSRHTKRVGYSDNLQSDGSWVYTCQGEKGDQNPNSFANSLLTNQEKKILLFSTLEPNGPDHQINVAAICPNCHREAHYCKDKQTLKDKLAQKIIEKENGF